MARLATYVTLLSIAAFGCTKFEDAPRDGGIDAGSQDRGSPAETAGSQPDRESDSGFPDREVEVTENHSDGSTDQAGNSDAASESHQADSDADAPSLIPRAGLGLWLQASRGVTVSGGLVTAWHDQSGNGMDAQAGLDSPAFVVNASGQLPAVRFESSLQALTLGPGFEDWSAGLSIFAVVRVHVTNPQSPVPIANIIEMRRREADRSHTGDFDVDVGGGHREFQRRVLFGSLVSSDRRAGL